MSIEPTPRTGEFALDQQSAEQMKEQTANARAEMTRQQIALQERLDAEREELERERAKMEAEYQERMSALEAKIAPMKAELARLEETSWTVDLYLGRHEDIELIADGTPAPANTPLTIRQTVLAADEESLIYADGESQRPFDHRDMDTFVQWLTASPGNRDRIIPDQRGVVAIVPTRQDRRYGNAYEDAARAEQNTRAHWVIRNGERLYLMVTDPQLKVGDRVLPRRSEFVDMFYDRLTHGSADPVPLKPGSARWIRAEAEADERRRHYMRLMLVLQGLIDRSAAFLPLPDGGINLLSVASQESGKVVLVDEEGLVLTDGRPPFREWQRALNAQLRPGLRVVLGAGIGQHDYADEPGNSRLSPVRAEKPPVRTPLMVEDRRDGGFVVRYDRTEEIYDSNMWREDPNQPGWGWRGGWRTPSTRASALLRADDTFVLPLDLASIEDLEYYLNSRGARTSYQTMVPAIQSALRAKADESEAEAPLRQALAGAIAREADYALDTEALDAELADLCAWWKQGNRYARALAGDSETEAAASVAILAEWHKRQKAKPNAANAERVVAEAKRTIEGLLAVVYTRSKKFVALSPSGTEHGPWVTQTEFSAAGVVTSDRPWTVVPPRTLATMVTLWESPEWRAWDKHPDLSAYLTAPEREDLISRTRQWLSDRGHEPLLVTERRVANYGSERGFLALGWTRGVDPTDHEVYAERNRGMEAFVTTARATWERGRDGVNVDIAATRTRWGTYSQGKPGDPSLPFWKGNGNGEAKDALVWRGEGLDRALELSRGHHEMAASHAEQRRAESHAIESRASAWTKAAIRAYEVMLVAEAREAFAVDFGAEAAADEALWHHHLGTLSLDRKVPSMPHELGEMMRRLARANVPADGKTVRDLAQIDAGLREDGTTIDDKVLGRWADLAITTPDDTHAD